MIRWTEKIREVEVLFLVVPATGWREYDVWARALTETEYENLEWHVTTLMNEDFVLVGIPPGSRTWFNWEQISQLERPDWTYSE